MKKQPQTLVGLSSAKLEQFLVELANVEVDLGAIRRLQERFAAFIPPVTHEYLFTQLFQRYSAFDDLLPAEGEGEVKERRYAAFDYLGGQPRGKVFSAAYIESLNKTDREQLRIGFDTDPKFRLPSDDIERKQAEGIVWMLALSNMLRNLWTEPDLRQKEGRAFLFRLLLYSAKSDVSAVISTVPVVRELLGRARFPRIPPPIPFEQALNYLIKYADRARYCANPECPAPYFFV